MSQHNNKAAHTFISTLNLYLVSKALVFHLQKKYVILTLLRLNLSFRKGSWIRRGTAINHNSKAVPPNLDNLS